MERSFDVKKNYPGFLNIYLIGCNVDGLQFLCPHLSAGG